MNSQSVLRGMFSPSLVVLSLVLVAIPGFSQQSGSKYSAIGARKTSAPQRQGLPRSQPNVKLPVTGKTSANQQELARIEHQSATSHVAVAPKKSPAATAPQAPAANRASSKTSAMNFAYHAPRGTTNSNTKAHSKTP